MSFSSWLRNRKRSAPAARRPTQTTSRQRTSFCPRLEALEDRALPSGFLSINDVTHVSAPGGQTAFIFTVRLSQPSKQPVDVNYASANGTATAAGGDFVATAGTLRFAKGQTTRTITVLVNAPTLAEPTETFFVQLSGARHATIADGSGVGTIVPPSLTANNDSNWTYLDTAVEGNVLYNDLDPSGGGLTVSSVNGSAGNVGTTIQLASGALLKVNLDGSYVYDPNGAFNYLVGTGEYADDTFTYSVTDSVGAQSAATVFVDIYDPYF